jgi:hypothetical protein
MANIYNNLRKICGFDIATSTDTDTERKNESSESGENDKLLELDNIDTQMITATYDSHTATLTMCETCNLIDIGTIKILTLIFNFNFDYDLVPLHKLWNCIKINVTDKILELVVIRIEDADYNIKFLYLISEIISFCCEKSLFIVLYDTCFEKIFPQVEVYINKNNIFVRDIEIIGNNLFDINFLVPIAYSLERIKIQSRDIDEKILSQLFLKSKKLTIDVEYLNINPSIYFSDKIIKLELKCAMSWDCFDKIMSSIKNFNISLTLDVKIFKEKKISGSYVEKYIGELINNYSFKKIKIISIIYGKSKKINCAPNLLTFENNLIPIIPKTKYHYTDSTTFLSTKNDSYVNLDSLVLSTSNANIKKLFEKIFNLLVSTPIKKIKILSKQPTLKPSQKKIVNEFLSKITETKVSHIMMNFYFDNNDIRSITNKLSKNIIMVNNIYIAVCLDNIKNINQIMNEITTLYDRGIIIDSI